METPTQDLAGGHQYAAGFGDDGRAAKLDHIFSASANEVVASEGTFPLPPKEQLSAMDMWDTTEEMIGIAKSGMIQPQPMYVHPCIFADVHGDNMMSLRKRASQTPSLTSDLRRSSRPSSSAKSETSGTSNSLSVHTNITPPEPEPPRKRMRQPTKVKKEEQVEDDKRNKFLERNRIAASKCREKKKQFVSELEETRTALESQHAQLQIEYNTLVTEVGSLKHTLMTHAKCNDPNIDTWISNEARKFVQTSDLFGHQRAAAATAAAPSNQTRQSSVSSVQHGGHGGGLGSFSSTGTGLTRRDSIAHSQGTLYDYGQDDMANAAEPGWMTSLTQPSPTGMGFPSLSSPKLGQEPITNFDHMPDELFDEDH